MKRILTIEEYEKDDDLWTVNDYFEEHRKIKLNVAQCASISMSLKSDCYEDDILMYVIQNKYEVLVWHKKSLDTMDTDICLDFTISEYCKNVLNYTTTKAQASTITLFLKLEGCSNANKVKRGEYYVNTWNKIILDYYLFVKDYELYVRLEFNDSSDDYSDFSIKIEKNGQDIKEDRLTKKQVQTEIDALEKEMNSI